MNYTTLDYIKAHLNLNADYTLDDEYLEGLWDACLNAVEMYIDDNLEDIVEENDDTLPPALRQAALLLLGTYYSSRESNSYGVVATEVPKTFDFLTHLYRNYSGKAPGIYEVLSRLEARIKVLEDKQAADDATVYSGSSSTNVTTTVDESGAKTITVDVTNMDEGNY